MIQNALRCKILAVLATHQKVYKPTIVNWLLKRLDDFANTQENKVILKLTIDELVEEHILVEDQHHYYVVETEVAVDGVTAVPQYPHEEFRRSILVICWGVILTIFAGGLIDVFV